MNRGFVDLHCHWVPGIDDGARSATDAIAMLQGLQRLGFDQVIATPHMRPGLFDNSCVGIRAAYDAICRELPRTELPRLDLSCEHYFDDVVMGRILEGNGVPYPGGHAILLEFYDQDFPPTLRQQLFELRTRQLRPVIAHPERYRRIWSSPEVLEELVQGGAVALLDIAALAGKYGSRARRCAEELLDADLYYAACSDCHRPEDIEAVDHGMRALANLHGEEELAVLFRDGPLDILAGQVQE